MTDEQKLREQIDACRADSDDLRQPELGELAAAAGSDAQIARHLARSHDFDRTVRAAVHDVAVPPDLLARLLAAQEARDSEQQTGVGPQEPGGGEQVVLPVRRKLLSRRALAIFSTIAALVLLAVGVSRFWPRPQEVVSAAELADRADNWMRQALPLQDWQQNLKLAPQKTHPIPGNIVGTARAWRRLKVMGDPNAVAYDLTRSGGQRAMLFVVRSPAKYRVAAPPAFTPISASRGLRLVGWQTGDRLYVLAVQEDGQHLEDFIRRQRVT